MTDLSQASQGQTVLNDMERRRREIVREITKEQHQAAGLHEDLSESNRRLSKLQNEAEEYHDAIARLTRVYADGRIIR